MGTELYIEDKLISTLEMWSAELGTFVGVDELYMLNQATGIEELVFLGNHGELELVDAGTHTFPIPSGVRQVTATIHATGGSGGGGGGGSGSTIGTTYENGAPGRGGGAGAVSTVVLDVVYGNTLVVTLPTAVGGGGGGDGGAPGGNHGHTGADGTAGSSISVSLTDSRGRSLPSTLQSFSGGSRGYGGLGGDQHPHQPGTPGGDATKYSDLYPGTGGAIGPDHGNPGGSGLQAGGGGGGGGSGRRGEGGYHTGHRGGAGGAGSLGIVKLVW